MSRLYSLAFPKGDYPTITMKCRDIEAGYCVAGRPEFVVPSFALTANGEPYAVAYIIHEFTHVVHHLKRKRREKPHSKRFKRMEDGFLQAFNLRIVRFKAYPKQGWYNGKLAWERTLASGGVDKVYIKKMKGV